MSLSLFSILALSKEAIDKICFGKMSIRSQKLLFVPLTQISWRNNPDYDLVASFEVKIPKDYIQEALGVHYDDEHIGSKIKEWTRIMNFEINGIDNKKEIKKTSKEDYEKLYKIFEFKRCKKDVAIFQIVDPSAVVNLAKSKSGFLKFPTNAIMSFNHKYTIPLYIGAYYYGSPSLESSDPKERVLTATTMFLKRIFGMSICDYVSFSDGTSEEDKLFYELYAIHCTNWMFKHSNDEIEKNQKLFLKEFNSTSNWLTFNNLEEINQKFAELKKAAHFKRTEFNENILQRAIIELNASGLLEFHLQRIQKRGNSNESATWEKSYFSIEHPLKDDIDISNSGSNKPLRNLRKDSNYVLKFKKII